MTSGLPPRGPSRPFPSLVFWTLVCGILSVPHTRASGLLRAVPDTGARPGRSGSKQKRLSVPTWTGSGRAGTCSAVWGRDLHGVGGHVGRVRAPVFTGAGEGDALLVAGELDEPAQLLLGERLQGPPEELDVLVRLHQPHLVHGMGLGRRDPRCEQAQATAELLPPSLGVCTWATSQGGYDDHSDTVHGEDRELR